MADPTATPVTWLAPQRPVEGGTVFVLPSDEEEAQFVEEALHCVKTGNAGHWPTVAGYLADEVERLQAQIVALVEEKRQLIVGFKAVNDALAISRLSSGGGH